MRNYSQVSPKFWIGETGRKLRGDQTAQLVAMYLITAPFANMIGVYYCPVSVIVNDIYGSDSCRQNISPSEGDSKPLESPFEGVLRALKRLQEASFCIYDFQNEWVFVRNMARWQIAQKLSEKDNRSKNVRRSLEELPEAFKLLFINEYNEDFHLGYGSSKTQENQSKTEAPSKPLESPSEDPSKPGTGTGTGNNSIYTHISDSYETSEQSCKSEKFADSENSENLQVAAELSETAEKKLKTKKTAKSKTQNSRTSFAVARPDEVDEQTWNDWVSSRKAKRAPVTQTVLNHFINESKKAGITLSDAITICQVKNWQGFSSEWYENLPESEKVNNGYKPLWRSNEDLPDFEDREIVLTDEQRRLISDACHPVEELRK